MRKFYTKDKPLPEEREVTINIIQDDNGEWIAELDTNIRKYANKCIKQGWTQTSETICTADNSWAGASFTAPAKAISIGKAVRSKREYTEEQKQAIRDRMAAYRESQKN